MGEEKNMRVWRRNGIAKKTKEHSTGTVAKLKEKDRFWEKNK